MATVLNNYTGDGSTTDYSFTFEYLSTNDIKVNLNGVNTTEYFLASPTIIRFNTAPIDGTAIEIRRETDVNELNATFFPGSSIRAQDLNNNFQQTLYVTQETVQQVANSDATSVVETANEALSVAQQANAKADAVADSSLSTGDNISELVNDTGYITGTVVTDVIVGGDPSNGISNGVKLSPAGAVNVSKGSSGQPIWKGFTAGNPAETSLINANGNATFAGFVKSRETQSSDADNVLATKSYVDANSGGGGGGIEEAPTDGQQYARQSAGWSVVTGGGGDGGGDTNYITEYSGASAWASVEGDGTLNGGLNISSVTRTGTGNYTVVFSTPMPDANYSVTASPLGDATVVVKVVSRTATQFEVQVRTTDNNTPFNVEFGLQVFATNALPPKGGTGTDAWATFAGVTANATPVPINASFNVASVTRNGKGTYNVVFTTPMPSANYAVTLGAAAFTSKASNKSATGFTVEARGSNLENTDSSEISFSVNATNATLPQTVTQEQIDTAINNPGAAAWGVVDKTEVNGPCNVAGGINIAAVTRTAEGVYEVVFTTPMPDANYSVTTASYNDTSTVQVSSRTATGCVIEANTTGNNTPRDNAFSLQVFATNALPPKGGTGTDAWGRFEGQNSDGACTVGSNFNLGSASRFANGEYEVLFTTPMPTDDYALTVTSSSPQNQVSSATTTGFTIICRDSGGTKSNPTNISFQVNATNATLPQTVTQEQIDAAINNPGASAWGSFDGTAVIKGGMNFASVTRNSKGNFTVAFTTPMPDANYSVVASSEWTQVGTSNLTSSGFEVELAGGSGADQDGDCQFVVFATNAVLAPPLTQDQIVLKEADGSVTFAGTGTFGTGKTGTSSALTIGPDSDRKAELRADGSAVFGGRITQEGADCTTRLYRKTTNAGDTLSVWVSDVGGSNTDQITFSANGSASFADNVTIGPVNVSNTSNTGSILWKDGGISCIVTDGPLFRGYSTGGSSPTSQISNQGDAVFSGNVSAGNVTFSLPSGAVLDVKDRLTKVDGALQALKTAAAASTDFAALKAAIATALCDI